MQTKINREYIDKGFLKGQIIRSQSGFLTVMTEKGEFTCHLRGRLKKGRRTRDIVAVGDWVWISPLQNNKGMVETIEPRIRMLSRMAPTARGEYQQIIVANPDQLILIFACEKPPPKLKMLDRFLIIAEKAHIPCVVLFNKIDLMGLEKAKHKFGFYHGIGYEVLYTSAKTGIGINQLREKLIGKISVFAGPSGAGKSSLLNLIQPGLGLAVREVSKMTTKGRHTTVVRELFPLDEGGYVADTPGLKALALWDIEPEEVDGYFPEFREIIDQCQFNDCTHSHEPGCAIKKAVAEGTIHPHRYESYLRIRFGDDDRD
ncbi:MAG: ribosome small subunit-dependent GTPase A [Anaerolineales bacterium]|nr:ribosome small subunit-dependent GTPase A [Anaerolineales bacterium]